MAVTIIDASTINVTGGTSGSPLTPTHITTLANWPAGTTQATVDSYITKTASSWTFNIQSGKKIVVGGSAAGYLDISDANFVSKGLGSYLHAGPSGVITGGRYVSGKVFGRPTWTFELGGISAGNGDTNPSSVTGSFLSGTGQLNCVGLRIINQHQQPGSTGGHTAFVFYAGSGGSFTLQDLEVLSEGNAPVYVTFNATQAGSSVSFKEARVGAIRHSSNNVSLSFGDGGWIGGDNGTAKPKFLVPSTASTYVGFSPVFQSASIDANNILNITNLNFSTPDVTLKNSYVEVGRIAMYPNSAPNGRYNSTRVERDIYFSPTAPDGSSISQFTAFAKTTQGFVKVNGKFNTGGYQSTQIWRGVGYVAGTGDGAYCFPETIVDDRSMSILLRHPSRNEATAAISGEQGAVTVSTVMGLDAAYTADGSLVTGVSAVATRATTANILKYSEQFNNSLWVKNTCSVTANTTTDPIGGNTADTLTSTGSAYMYQSFIPDTSTQYTFSLYVKALTAGATVRVSIHNPAAAEIAGTSITTTGAWQRVSVTATTPSTNTAVLWANISGLTNGQSAYIWGAQLEKAPAVGTYQPTTTEGLSTSTVTSIAVTVSNNNTYDSAYNYLKWWLCQTAQMDVPNFLSVNGGNLSLSSICTLTVSNGVTFSEGSTISYWYTPTITLAGTGKITGVYGTTAGVSTVLELRDISDNAAVAVWDATSGATELYQSNGTGLAKTYTVYYPPGSSGTVKHVARELYGYQRAAESIPLAPGKMWWTASDIPDVGITQSTQATVAAYTALETGEKLYDFIALKRLDSAFIKLGQIATRSGTAIDFGTYSGVVNKDAASVLSVVGNTVTLKGTGLAGTSKYSKIIAAPPATWVANSTEVIDINLEDGNGDSSVTIKASGVSTFEVWKITDATSPDDYATGTLMATVGVGKFRFLHANGYELVIRDRTTNFRVVAEAEKGDYEAALFFGASVQLAQAPEVSQIKTNLALMQIDVDSIKGAGFVSGDSLHSIRAALGTPLQAADYVAPANADIATIKAKTDTLVNADLSSVATAAQVTALGSPLQASDYIAPPSAANNASAIRTELATELGRIDATVSSRLATSGYTAPANADIAAIKTKTDVLVNTDLSGVATHADTVALSVQIGSPLQAGDYTAPTAPPSAVTVAGAVRTELATELGRIDTAISSRLATAGYTAPANADIAAIKTKTDILVNGPTLAQIEASPVLAKEATVASRASQASVTALGTPLQASSYTAPDNSTIGQIKTKVDTLQNPDLSGVATALQVAAVFTAVDNVPTAQENADAVRAKLPEVLLIPAAI